ncbi:tRNA (adenosine(37)-N6)-dimethylallyltransferase MiaA [Aporhodopirellula aestuarii]|uniref:tRNA dimethylallyltransferase n=1 Tax=Aporhodopirellula aestuarii TaxID=2950107 RepID=A0ABT0U613_9BACT|nr:tRNA (adenosine(37)-N6)-dimethylallyltransferase MiaA [Aporhodopirellula aestuarii]MCM2372242.1 tRNA (adenosine(37)-N6)-dimethylallyltransferase MiaA [Aporhodopirellula aestuarii]
MTPELSPERDSLDCFPALLDRVLVLTGPTASGKTQLALRVAEALTDRSVTRDETAPKALAKTAGPSIEIISLDSIAVYRQMDIGTAKPSAEEQRRVVHHLIDVVQPDHEYSVAEYLTAAHRCVEEIWARGNRPMFVGGTPMYLKAILRGFDPGPPADETFRSSVMEDVKRYGIEALRQRLQQVDPLSAARIDASDVRRMIRALEFARHVGTPISHRQHQFDVERSPEEGLVFTLQTPRAVLHRRIAARVERMFAAGLVDEIRRLKQNFAELSKTARTAVGYREVLESSEFAQWQSLPDNEPKLTEPDWSVVAEQILFHTRRLARRQETWFRSFGEMRGIATHTPAESAKANGVPTDDKKAGRDASVEMTARPIEQLVDEMTNVIVNHPIWKQAR